MAWSHALASSGLEGPEEVGAHQTPDLDFAEVQGMLLSYLRARGASTEDAADIVQETLLGYLRHCPQIHHARAWLYTVARRHLQRLRSRQPYWASMPSWDLETFDGHGSFVTSGMSTALPFDSMLHGAWEVEALISRLPPRQSQAMSMLVEGFGYDAIAAHLGMDRNAAHALVARARQNLRQALGGQSEAAEAPSPRPANAVMQRQPTTPHGTHDGDEGLLATLREELNQVWQRAGSPTVRAISMAMGREISYPTVHRALKCTSVPKWNVVERIAMALDAQPSELASLRALNERCARARPHRRTA